MANLAKRATKARRKPPAAPMSATDWLVRALRTGLQAIPFGSAIDAGFFGTIDDRRAKRLDAYLQQLGHDLEGLDAEVLCRVDREFFKSDEFAYFFENILRRVMGEITQAKIDALRGILVSVIVDQTFRDFDKKSSFLKTVDAIESIHIQILRLLGSRHEQPDLQRFLTHSDICRILNAKGEANSSFVYSALDTLANREFVISGPVPFDDKGQINKPRQTFRATALGVEFLRFIRVPADLLA